MCCGCGCESHQGAGHKGHHHSGGCGCGCGCSCGGHSRFGPTFWTREEKISYLEQYLEGIQEEQKAIEERITALKQEK